MERETMLAYFAGFIDGEGCLGIKKDPTKGRGVSPTFSERLSVAGINKTSIALLADFFGRGKIVSRKHKKSPRLIWHWDITDRMAVAVIRQVYPYLRIKKAEADLLLALSATKRKGTRKGVKGFTVPTELTAYRQSLYEAIKALHFHPS